MDFSSSSPEEPEDPIPFPITLATLSLSFLGLLGNVTIVMATARTRQLQNRCGVLIATLAVADTIICSYLVQLRVQQLLGWFSMANSSCFLVSIHGLFSLSVQSFIGLCIGIDRLMAVVAPIRYKTLPVYFHVLLILSSLGYAAIVTGLGGLDSSPKTTVPVCMPPTAFNVRSRLAWIGCSFALSLLTLAVYLVAQYKCVRIGRSVERTNRSSFLRLRKLLNSLTVVVGVYVATWFLTVIALLVTQVWSRDSTIARTVELHAAWLVIANASLNFPIYAWRAPEYRKAFSALLCPCLRKNRKGSAEFLTSSSHLFYTRGEVTTRTTIAASERRLSAEPPMHPTS